MPEGTHGGAPSRLPIDALLVALGAAGLVGAGQKLLLLATIFLAGFGMHRLASTAHTSPRYFAGLLYALNPFVYDRIWSGQWFVLLGYALLPWGVRAFVRLLDEGGASQTWACGAVAALIGAASPHMLGLLGVVWVAMALARLSACPDRVATLRRALAPAIPTLLLCLYWLLPTPALTNFLRNVDERQLALYRTVPDERFGIYGAVAGLQGFWNNPDPVGELVPVWPLLAAALVALALYGLGTRVRSWTAWAFAGAGAFGFLLALGTGSPVTRGLFELVIENVEPARGYREPQKGVALLALAYAYLGAVGVEALLKHERRRRVAAVVGALCVALPLLYGHRTVWGLSGRMATSAYPESWGAARDVLEGDAAGSRTLFLPWSGYVELSFAHDRLVANPAPHFFSTPILASRSVGGGDVNVDDPVERRVRALLADRGRTLPFERCLARLGVGHVLVANEVGGEAYGWLARRPALDVVRRYRELVLYRLAEPGGLVMRADGDDACGPVTPLPAKLDDPAHVRLMSPLDRRPTIGLQDPEGWRVEGDGLVYASWSTYRRNYLIGLVAVLAAAMLAALRARVARYFGGFLHSFSRSW